MILTVKVSLRTAEYASIIAASMDVDKEPRPDKIQREVRAEACVLIITYTSSDVKLIRTASSGFLENLNLAIQVINELSPEAMRVCN